MFCLFVFFFISHFGYKSGIKILIAPVPDHLLRKCQLRYFNGFSSKFIRFNQTFLTKSIKNTLLFQFININKCKAGTSISADAKCVNKIIIYIKIQVIL